MTIITPIQQLQHQIEKAYADLLTQPQSLEKQQCYDDLKLKMDTLIYNARKQIDKRLGE